MDEDFDEDFDIEEEYYNVPIRCDYCYGDYEALEMSYCEDPERGEIKREVYVNLHNICDSCCQQRVQEEGCSYNSCLVFQEKFVRVRNEKVRIIFGKLDLRNKNISHLNEIIGLEKLGNLSHLDLSSNNFMTINGHGILERLYEL